MTDREKLLSLINEIQDHGLYYGEHGFGIHVENERLADHLIQSGVMSQRWIPVTERLPESDVFVLGCSEGVLVFFGFFKAKTWYDLVFECQVLGVTHWMPMPEPPRGE